MLQNMLQTNARLFGAFLLFLALGLNLNLHSHASFDGNMKVDTVALHEPKDESSILEPEVDSSARGAVGEAVEPQREAEKLAAEQPGEPQPFSYQIQPGDTLDHISQKFGISAASLTVENLIEDPYQLVAGEQLVIPAEEAAIQLPDGKNKIIKHVMKSTLTAYTAGEESTGKTKAHAAYGITKSGSKAEEGRTIAVDPAIIPIGTDVFIDGIGIRTAEDTGSAVRGARIDVFMEDLDQAVHFGVKRNVKVYVLSTDNVTR